jgi:hypothetical protein
MMGFKAFHSAQATIAGIETAHMIRKKVEEICFLSAPMSAQSELHIYLGFEGSVASIIKNEAGLILGHNYPAKAINCL